METPNDLGFRTNGTNRMMVKSNCNVGIGTTNPDAKLDVNGDLNVAGELQRSATGKTNMLPICYGFIQFDGTIITGSGNFTAVRKQVGEFTITIDGENFNAQDYIATVTAMGIPFLTSYSASENNLIIEMENSAGSPVLGNVSFVVYKP